MQDTPFPAPTAQQALPFLWRDTATHRLMLATLLATLENALLLTDSATRTLEDWSRTHSLAPTPTVRAVRVDTARAPCPPLLCEKLELTPLQASTMLRYRHVRLMCGQHVLSHAQNWYRPDRLNASMNTELETTEIPFGRAVTQLAFTRQLVEAKRLWAPLPHGWEIAPLPTGSGDYLTPPAWLFRHQAILQRHDSAPFSAVTETYTADLLRFTPPSLPTYT
ncbi:hypothetical protein [Acetobacter orientalis]|uniref:hypothetical protein n=1 Tax=Acetobacter orientalis TaxID=146474 RepID=UPI0039E96D0A